MKTITSTQNSEIKTIVKLHSLKGRLAEKKFIAEGLRTCQTLILSGCLPDQLYVTENILEIVQTFIKTENITIVTSTVMKKISTSTTPSGILGIFSIPKDPKINQLGAGIVLAQIADPGNMGTLIRSCAAMGFKSVVSIEGADPWAPKVIQASAGTIMHVNLFQWSWTELIKNKGALKLIALVASGGEKPSQIDTENSLLVIGSEAHGIPNAWLNECDATMTIEMPGKTESLNAAVAGSIAMYLVSMRSPLKKS